MSNETLALELLDMVTKTQKQIRTLESACQLTLSLIEAIHDTNHQFALDVLPDYARFIRKYLDNV